MKQIAAAMQHLESLRVVHGDLSCRNILVKNSSSICLKISDFGQAIKLPPDIDFQSEKCYIYL